MLHSDWEEEMTKIMSGGGKDLEVVVTHVNR